MSMLQNKYNIIVASHIQKIHCIEDDRPKLNDISIECLERLSCMDFPVFSTAQGEKMKKEILNAKEALDSLGGIVESFVINMPAGIGEPFFDSIESRLSHMIFSIPAVKGVEFGEGFNFEAMYGSEANDEYYFDNAGKVRSYTNHNGGVVGGLTNGMPINFKTSVKATPSIAREQSTVNLENKENEKLIVEGRHDPCIVQRAIPVIECATSIVLLDFILNK